jgi:uncharacterized protein YrrD
MTERPVSWLLLEKGRPVVGREGEELGQVAEVLGDEQRDIFDGLTVRTGLLGSSRYVPAEHVAAITTERVELDLTAAELEALDADGPQDR